MLKFWLCAILVLFAKFSSSARILALLPINAKSHFIVMEPILQELAARGHQLTVFSCFPQRKPLPNYTDVDFSHILPSLTSSFSLEQVKITMPNPWVTTKFINEIAGRTCKLMKEPQFQDLLKAKGKYDLMITQLFGTDCMTYFAYKLKLPLISITTSVVPPWGGDRFGVPDNPSYIPNYLVDFPPRMSLLDRTYNTVVVLYAKFWHHWVFAEKTRTEVEEYFGEPLPPLCEVVANTSLLLVNSYHALTQSRPFPPNVIEVGGIHIKEKKPLPQDLNTVINEAKSGVIIMSFGSLVRASSLPRSTITMFMNVFRNIPQTVILKYEDELPDAPKNVIVKKWLPQRDLVEHENVVAVIAHGGLASTIEAVYFGKPLIGVPFFADQYVNINTVVQKNGCIPLDLDSLTEEKIAFAIKEITTNPRYQESMRLLSQQYRDRPMTALQSAVYWTEYVIRHQGAPHLRPASVSLPLYQYLLLDVIALLLTSAAVSFYAIYSAFKFAILFVRRKMQMEVNLKKD